MVPEAFPSGQLLDSDNGSMDWDDTDTKWFRTDGPTVELNRKLMAQIRVRRTRGATPFTVALIREKVPGIWEILDRVDAPLGEAKLTAVVGKGEIVYLQGARHDAVFGDLEFDVKASGDVTLVLCRAHGATRLICTEETGGWGADDIELGITADAVEVVYLDNDAIGDFEQDPMRDLNQWVPAFVPYFGGVEFMVKELDDIGHDDIGRETLRP